jgi:hypothetical protein
MELAEMLAQRKSLDHAIALEEARRWFFRPSVAGHLVDACHFSIADLELMKPVRGSRKSRPIYYQNLATGELWNGEGEPPVWFRAKC